MWSLSTKKQWVKSTVDSQRILFSTKATIDACHKHTDKLDEISEMCCAKPIKRNTLDVKAFFCDRQNNPKADPVLKQPGTVRLCVQQQNSTSWHIENLITVVLTQPKPGVSVQYIVRNAEGTQHLSFKECAGGICNIQAIVSSRFFSPRAGPIRIVGIAVNAKGPPHVRSLKRRKDRRLFLADEEEEEENVFSLSPFELYLRIIPPLSEVPTRQTENNVES